MSKFNDIVYLQRLFTDYNKMIRAIKIVREKEDSFS